MAGWNDESEKTDEPQMPHWLQWALALAALGLGAWFGWVMF